MKRKGKTNKKCPFCGCFNLKLAGDYIECKCCGAFGPTPTYDRLLAKELVAPLVWDAWNRRAR